MAGHQLVIRERGGVEDDDAHDDELERLHVPNSVFCQHLQGANEASLYTYPETLL